MSTRLARGGRLINRTQPIEFSFNGKRFKGFQGDTLAAGLLANDQVLVGRSFWTHLLHMDAMLEDGTISEDDLELFKIVDTPQEAWDIVRGFYGL